MSINLSTVRDRIRIRLRDTDFKRQTYTTPELDQAICDSYLTVQSMLPGFEVYTASAFTISAGASTFTLPATVSQWTGNDGGAEYRSLITVKLSSKGHFLKKMTWEELMSYRHGFVTLPTAEPRAFALSEDQTQGLTGYTDTLADQAYACDLMARMSADDLRDFIGAGTDDLDDVEVQMSRLGSQALILITAADLLERMTPEDLQKRRLSGRSVGAWRKEGLDLIYREAARRHDLNDVGRVQRWAP